MITNNVMLSSTAEKAEYASERIKQWIKSQSDRNGMNARNKEILKRLSENSYTKQQIIFIYELTRLHNMWDAMPESGLADTHSNYIMKIGEEEGNILAELYLRMQRYFRTIENRFCGQMTLSREDWEDLDSEMVLMFLERILHSHYDPVRAAPTTYFKSYAYETVRKWLRKNGWLKEDKEAELDPEEDVWSSDEEINPEEEALKEDCKRTLMKAARDVLTKEEWAVFSAYANVSEDYCLTGENRKEVHGKRDSSYAHIARVQGLKVHRVKKIVRISQEKLRKHPGIMAYAVQKKELELA